MLPDIDKQSLVLESERLILRPLTVTDVTEAYVRWLNDDETNRYMETRHNHQSRETILEFVERQYLALDTFLFGMFLKTDGRHIGNIKVGPVKSNHSVADVSLFIGDKECWGQGYAAESIRAVSEFGLGLMGLSKLSAVAYAINQGSVKAFLNAGFVQEGLRRGHYLLDGKPADIVEVGMIRADLESSR